MSPNKPIGEHQCMQNPDGLRRLAAALGLRCDGPPMEVYKRYARWIKRNPQPRVGKR